MVLSFNLMSVLWMFFIAFVFSSIIITSFTNSWGKTLKVFILMSLIMTILSLILDPLSSKYLLILLLSIGLAIVEIIVPGFGIFGILSITGICYVSYVLLNPLQLITSIIILILILYLKLPIKLVKETLISKNLSDVNKMQDTDIDNEFNSLVGNTVKALIDFKPVGYIEVNNKKVTAISNNGIIEKDSLIKIIEYKNKEFLVEKVVENKTN